VRGKTTTQTRCRRLCLAARAHCDELAMVAQQISGIRKRNFPNDPKRQTNIANSRSF